MKELKRWRLFDIQSILRNEILDLYNLISGKWGFIKAYSLSLLNKSSQLVLRKVILAFQNFRLNYFKFIVFFWVFRIFKSSHFENKKDKTVFYMLICKLEASGLTFTCSKSVMFKVNHKNIRTTSLTSFWCFYW